MKGTMKTAFISLIFLFGSAICQWSIEPRQKIEPRENSGKVICIFHLLDESFCYWVDWAVGTVLKMFAIFLNYPIFEGSLILYFHGQNKYKVRVTVCCT